MREIHLFEKDENHGAREAITRVGSLESPEIKALLGDAGHEQLVHDVMLLD